MEEKSANCDFERKPMLVKLVMLGRMGVGKSAMTVRFLTKKFIGEYDPYIGSVYQHHMKIASQTVNVEILDPGGKDFLEQNEAYGLWGDAFILVYAINDQSSFEDVLQIKRTLEKIRGSDPSRVILVGNKRDTEKERRVTTQEGENFASSMECSFHEISAATNYDDVDLVFTKIIKETVQGLVTREAVSCVHRDSNIKIKEIVAKHAVRQRALSSLKETIDEYCTTKGEDLAPDSDRDRSNTCIF